MVNSTTNTYQMKREILNFSNKMSKHLSKPDKKFSAERVTRHLNNGTSSTALKSYLSDDIGFSKLGLMDQLEYEKFTSE